MITAAAGPTRAGIGRPSWTAPIGFDEHSPGTTRTAWRAFNLPGVPGTPSISPDFDCFDEHTTHPPVRTALLPCEGMMFDHLSTPRAAAAQRRRAPSRFAGIAAGPAESNSSTTSGTYLADIGETFEVVARVAGTTPRHEGDADDIVRHCFRTVDHGLALCCPLPDTQPLRLGSVIRVRGTVTGQRTQGTNLVTEIAPSALEPLG